jgi:hypothetical protein
MVMQFLMMEKLNNPQLALFISFAQFFRIRQNLYQKLMVNIINHKLIGMSNKMNSPYYLDQ